MPATIAAMSPSPSLLPTARQTGLLYLAMGLSGMLGFLLVRPTLFVPDDPSQTLARVIAHPDLARLGVALEMATVVAQALVALWFFRLFRSVDDFAAAAIAVFGVINAAAVLASAAALTTALQLARTPLRPGGADVQLLYLVSQNFWLVGSLFFGLWLVPMGWCVLRSRWMPRLLGWFLVVGGIGYVLSALVGVVAPNASLAAGLLVMPATVGELWMIGYLLIRGIGAAAAD